MESLASLRSTHDSWNRCVVFDSQGNILFKDDVVTVSKDDLVPYLQIMDNRDATIRRGILLFNQAYDLTRFHPPLVFGRRGDPIQLEGEGIAVFQFANKQEPSSLFYALITYPFPSNAAKAAPELQEFCAKVSLIV